MAKRPAARASGVHVHVHAGAGGPKKRDKEKPDVFAQISELRESIRGDSGFHVMLWRWGEIAKDYEYLAPIPIADFSLEYVRGLYGGGRYRARVTNEAGKFIDQGGQWLFPIAGPPKHPDQPAGAPAGSPELQRMFDRIEGLLAAKPAGGGADVGDMALKIATSMASVQAATMTAMQAMMAKGNGGGDRESVVETVTGVLDLVERLRPSHDTEPSVVNLFAGFADALKEVATTQRANGQGLPPRRVLAPPPAPGAPPAQPAAAGGADMARFDPKRLKPYIAQLVSLAQRDKDPNLYAEVLLDSLDGYPAALTFLRACRAPADRAQLETQLVALYPELAPYPTWVRELFAAVWESLDEEAADADANPAPAATGAADIVE